VLLARAHWVSVCAHQKLLKCYVCYIRTDGDASEMKHSAVGCWRFDSPGLGLWELRFIILFTSRNTGIYHFVCLLLQ